MRTLRLRYSKSGGHYHCKVFCGPRYHTLSKCGDLVFDEQDWPEITRMFRDVEILESIVPAKDPIEYLLNAMEHASQAESPAEANYAQKRKALLQAIGELRAAANQNVAKDKILVSREILDRFPELNPRNYNEEDVLALNAWAVELVRSAPPESYEEKT